MSKNYYVSGESNLICDSCGKKIKLHEARVRWDGLVVCQVDFEERQPQDFVRARQDKITVPLVRPRPTDLFVQTCDMATSSCYADLGTADCSQADQTWGMTYEQLYQYVYCSFTNRTAIPSIAVAGCATAGYNIDAYF